MDETTKAVIERVDALAERLGATGSELFNRMVDETVRRGWAELGLGMVGLLCTLAAMAEFARGLSRAGRLGDATKQEIARLDYGLGLGLCGALALLPLFLLVGPGLMKILAPVTHVIEKIL